MGVHSPLVIRACWLLITVDRPVLFFYRFYAFGFGPLRWFALNRLSRVTSFMVHSRTTRLPIRRAWGFSSGLFLSQRSSVIGWTPNRRTTSDGGSGFISL
jgi:hypothetical protein